MELRGAFTVAEGLDAGLSRGALRSTRYASPFHGVRATSEPRDVAAWCRAYATKMRSDAAFTGLTAARLWGIPLPLWMPDAVLDVTTPHGTARVGGRGVAGVQHQHGSVRIVERDGLRLVDPVTTWASLATKLDLADLVAAGDHLVTAAFASTSAALATLDELASAAARRRLRGRALAMRAASHIRVGPLSRPESLLRMLAVTGGLPEPACNLRVSPVLMFDLAWPDWRLGLDYHGASHRSAGQHAVDVRRSDLARQIGWSTMQVAAPDLFDIPFDLLGRLRSRLSGAGAAVQPVDPRQLALAKR